MKNRRPDALTVALGAEWRYSGRPKLPRDGIRRSPSATRDLRTLAPARVALWEADGSPQAQSAWEAAVSSAGETRSAAQQAAHVARVTAQANQTFGNQAAELDEIAALSGAGTPGRKRGRGGKGDILVFS